MNYDRVLSCEPHASRTQISIENETLEIIYIEKVALSTVLKAQTRKEEDENLFSALFYPAT